MEINKEYILELSRGLFELQESEKRKLEFKREWYDLTNANRIEEFCKDVAAMANTPGPDGFIVIGLGEDGTLTNSPILNCGLADASQITNIIIKRVRPSIQFEIHTITLEEEGNKVISVIKIPPSLDKPHVIGKYKNHQNYIPIRNGVQVSPANHADLEYMFYDRKNIVPDYALGFLPIHGIPGAGSKRKGTDTILVLTSRFILQNTGRNPIAIISANLFIRDVEPRISLPENEFTGYGFEWNVVERNASNVNYSFPTSPLIIAINEMIEVQMDFWVNEVNERRNEREFLIWRRQFQEIEHCKYSIMFKSINDRTFTSGVLEI